MDTYLFFAALMLLSSCFTNTAFGFPTWLSYVLSLVVGNVPPLVFLLIIFVI